MVLERDAMNNKIKDYIYKLQSAEEKMQDKEEKIEQL
jgi:hypothetical protein